MTKFMDARVYSFVFCLFGGVATLQAAPSILKDEEAFHGFFTTNKNTLKKTEDQNTYSSEPCCEVYPLDNNPSARGCVERDNVFVTGDFLLWKGSEDDVDLVRQVPLSANNLPTFEGTAQDPKLPFAYDPGFRLGLGVNMHYGNWDIYTNWTSLVNHSTTSKSADLPSFLLLPLYQVGTAAANIPLATSFRSHWKLNYNTFDVELGKALFLSQKVILRPFAGARTVWIHRTIGNHFYGMSPNYESFFLNPPSLINGPIDLKFSNDYWGLGLRMGLNSRWLLGEMGFGILANFSASLVTGPFKNKTTTTVYEAVSVEGTLLEKRSFTTRSNADLALGLDFGRCFCDWLYLYISASYNMTYWWNMLNRISYSTTYSHSSDLSLRGLDVQLRLDF